MVTAFIIASFITFLAILVGYVTCSLDRELINGLDKIIIRRIRWLLCIEGMGDKLPYEKDWVETRKTANESLTRFILALSDQQLVTGLAILITGYYQRCSISGYHFSLVADLAWFSSITHLSTLAVLHKYLMKNPVLKACRVCGMLSVLGLLFHSQLYVQWYVIPSLPIQCTFTVGFPNLLSAAKFGIFGVLGANAWLGIIFFLLFSYGNALVQLFHSKDSSLTGQDSASTGPDSKSSRATTVISWIDNLAREKLKIPQLPSASKRFEEEMSKLNAENPMPRFFDLTFSNLTFSNATKFFFHRSRPDIILRFMISEFVD